MGNLLERFNFLSFHAIPEDTKVVKHCHWIKTTIFLHFWPNTASSVNPNLEGAYERAGLAAGRVPEPELEHVNDQPEAELPLAGLQGLGRHADEAAVDVGLAVVPGEEAVAAGFGAVGSRRVEEADGQMGQS